MRLIILIAVLVSVFLVVRPSESHRNDLAAATPTLTVDGSRKYQRIEGFGVNANPASWKNGQLRPTLNLLIDELGMTIWRVVVEKADWENVNDNGDPYVFNWDYYRAIYETPKFQDLWSTIAYLNSRRVTVLLNVMGIVPNWMGGTVVNEEAEDEWAEMISSLVYYAVKLRHLQIQLLSPLNETDIGSRKGPSVGPVQYVRLLKKLIARLAKLEMNEIEIVAPDTASIDGAKSAYFPALMSEKLVMAKIPHFALHNYKGHSANIQRTIERSAYPDRSFWLTEWAAPCDRCETGQGTENEWEFARAVAKNLLNHIRDGAAAGLFYEGYDSFYEHHHRKSQWGLLAHNPTSAVYSPRKRFFAVGNISKFITTGSTRIAASASPGIHALAFYDSTRQRLTIVGHNSATTPQLLRIKLSNLPSVPSLAFYYTNARVNMKRAPDLPTKDRSVAVQVAADSIFALTGACH